MKNTDGFTEFSRASKLSNLDESPAEFVPTKHKLDLIFDFLFFLNARLFFFTKGAKQIPSLRVETLWDPGGRNGCSPLKKDSDLLLESA